MAFRGTGPRQTNAGKGGVNRTEWKTERASSFLYHWLWFTEGPGDPTLAGFLIGDSGARLYCRVTIIHLQ